MTSSNTEEILLPEEVAIAKGTDPRDLVIISIPKMGKSEILGALSRERNALILDLEKGGYDYINARKISTYDSQDQDIYDSYLNYIKYRNALYRNKGKYDFLIIDNLTELDALSEIGGTFAYMDTVIGKNYNRDEKTKQKLDYRDPDFRLVHTLPEGYGYQHTRKWFLDQIEIFRQIAPYRIYAAHLVDKYIKDDGKETVIGAEIALTGRLKNIFAAKVTSLCKLVADENERYLNFDVQNDSIVAGSRAPVSRRCRSPFRQTRS